MSEQEITTILGRGASFDGKLTFEGSVRIDGDFRGEIETVGRLIIGEHAKVRAQVSAGAVVVEGELRGDLAASGGLEIRASARVYGQVSVGTLVVERGSIFEGSCKMGHETPSAQSDHEVSAAE
jgi:cytoskeletal protein CcmA (bactofilin family)